MYNMFFGRRKKFQLNKAETTYKVHYLGNVMTSLIKGNYHHGQLNEPKLKQDCDDATKQLFKNNIEDENILDNEDNVDSISIKIAQENALNKRFNNTVCNVDKPVKILWDNHLKHNGHAGLKMKLTLTQGGLRVDTKDHGLTEYYGHRIHFIQSHPLHPKLFVWVYQHVGKNLKTEIRCHAALCQSVRDSRTIQLLLNDRLQRTFLEYKREKRRQQNSRLCNNKNGGLLAGQFGTRKRSFRSTKNYKPPVQHGMSSAPKLDDVIEEEEEIDEREINVIKIDEESENEETFIENEITPPETHSLDDEDDYGDDEDELNTNEQYEQHIDTTNKRPVTEQLILSSSSTSSTSSPSSSPLHSNLSSPSLTQNKQPSDVVNTSISSPSSSSHSSELINYSNQTYIHSETNSSEINDAKLVDNKFKNLIESLKLGDMDSEHKDFTEVSYDFLADLSKKNMSRSFSNRNYKLVTSSVDNPIVDETTNKPSGFYNPFRRTNISKSFSTFTTRLRQQQKQKSVDFFNIQNSLKNQLKEQQSNDDTNEFKHSQISRSTNGLSKNFSDSTSSPLSSPDLSTSSSSSLNSSIVTNKNCQLMIQSSND